MSTLEIPTPKTAALLEVATRLLSARRSGTNLETLARDLLAAFRETLARHGLDALTDSLADADTSEAKVEAVTASLGTIDLDGGGPRAVKPKQVIDATIAGLGWTVVDEPPDRSIALPDTARAAAARSIEAAVAALAAPKVRETIVADARRRVGEQHYLSFVKIAKELDDRGVRLARQPKVPLDAMQATQRALAHARHALVASVTRAAFDGVREAFAPISEEAAARLDRPVTLRTTVLDIAIARACDPRVDLTPTNVADVLMVALTELVPIAWSAAEISSVPYAASKRFVVGDVIEHPKFGRGTVTVSEVQRIDVEFGDGNHTLVHGR